MLNTTDKDTLQSSQGSIKPLILLEQAHLTLPQIQLPCNPRCIKALEHGRLLSWIPVLNLFLTYTFFYPGQKRCKSSQQRADEHTSLVCVCDRVTDKGTMTSFCKIIKHIKLLALALYYILSSVLTWHQWGRTEMKHDWGQLNDWLSVM